MTKSLSSLIVLLYIFVFYVPTFSQSLRINEVMSSNSETIADENSDYPDWIELYNASGTTVNLEDFGLSDNPKYPFKWLFPKISIAPNDFLMIYASGKNRTNVSNYWSTVIDKGDIWKYWIAVSEPPSKWASVDFDDENWESGPSGLGYGNDGETTKIPHTISCYFRKEILVEDAKNITNALLHIDYDDAFVAYLNDIEIARANIGKTGIRPAYCDTADKVTEPRMHLGKLPEMYIIENIQSLLKPGKNILAVQVHNSNANSSDLLFIPFLTFGIDSLSETSAKVSSVLKDTLPRLHTNFKISADDEMILITNPDGELTDKMENCRIPTDISKGRMSGSGDEFYYFDKPTPGSINSNRGFQRICVDPEFSQDGGLFNDDLSLKLSTASGSDSIYYTLDGSEPDNSTSLYSSAIEIYEHTVVRARVIAEGKIPGRIVTHTYFIDLYPTLPVISLSTNPSNFFDDDIGIYAEGDWEDPNYFKDWERPIHIEMYEPDGELGFSIDAGVKIHGGYTRYFPQKSLAIFARDIDAGNKIDYQIFEDKPIKKFNSVILRNSGHDWGHTMIRDGLMTGLLKSTDVDRQAYRPAIVYLNGKYWGLHNLREKINEDFIAANNSGIDPENIDLLELNAVPIEGDAKHYSKMINFIENNSLSDSANYAYVEIQMDTDNFIIYQAAEIYFNNLDWPDNNIKCWRPKSNEGKWRWIIYDTDLGFGLPYEYNWADDSYEHNTLECFLKDSGPDGHVPQWATFLLKSLLKNDQFRIKFINRFADFMNSNFLAESVISTIDSLQILTEQEIPAHYDFWGGPSIKKWNKNIQILRDFATYRPAVVQSNIMEWFDLPGTVLLTLDVAPVTGGKIKINSIMPNKYPWSGSYFIDNPVTLTAQAEPGYRFVKWEGVNPADSSSITISLNEDIEISAVFEVSYEQPGQVLINEINYHSCDEFDTGDWLELFNNSDYEMNISGYTFKDGNKEHAFVFPENTILDSQGYIVICRDIHAFTELLPTVNNIIGELGFGLSSDGEYICLLDNKGQIVDSLRYDDEAPWPIEPDGSGSTLSLINPNSDNSLPESWAGSDANGTPCAQNDVYIGVEDRQLDDDCRNDDITIYPNPANSYINVKTGKQTPVKYMLMNVLGQVLLSGRSDHGSFRVDLSGLPAGVYTLRIEDFGYKIIKT